MPRPKRGTLGTDITDDQLFWLISPMEQLIGESPFEDREHERRAWEANKDACYRRMREIMDEGRITGKRGHPAAFWSFAPEEERERAREEYLEQLHRNTPSLST